MWDPELVRILNCEEREITLEKVFEFRYSNKFQKISKSDQMVILRTLVKSKITQKIEEGIIKLLREEDLE